MKIGVSAFAWNSWFGEPLFDVLPALRDHGISGFEVPIFNPKDVPASAIRRALDTYDLECTVCAILPAGMNPISPDQAVRRQTHQHLVDCLQISAELGAKLMGGPLYAPIGYLPGRRRTTDEWSWAVECFQNLGSTLDKTGISLAIEPVNRSETFFLTTVGEARALCEAIGDLRIGVLIDTFHSNIEEKSIPGAVLSLGPLLWHIHVSENDRGVPGTGHVDFAGMIAALRQVRFEGYLMIEGLGHLRPGSTSPVAIWRQLDESPEAIAFEGAAYLRKLLDA